MKNISELLNNNEYSNATIAVVGANTAEVLKAVVESNQKLNFILFGEEEKIKTILSTFKKELNNVSIVNCLDNNEACDKAIQSIRKNSANVLMKGNIPTKDLLKAVLKKDNELYYPNQLLSHVAVLQIPNFSRILILTDAALNISPTTKQFVEIINNALRVSDALSMKKPVVALLAAIEKVNEKMPSTLIWQELKTHYQDKWVLPCIVDGPYSLDVAISPSAARIKNVRGVTAGSADILVVPNIESGNILYKALVHFMNTQTAGVVMGAKVPIVLTSRADTIENRLYAIALGAKIASSAKKGA